MWIARRNSLKILEMTAIRGATEEEAVAYSIGVEVSDGNGDEPFLMFNEV